MLLKGYTTLTDNPHTKILNLRLGEITLGWVDPETMEAETVKNLVDMVEVRFCIRAGDEDFININKHTRNIAKDLVNHPMKVQPAFLKPKGILIHSKRPNKVITTVLGKSPLDIWT